MESIQFVAKCPVIILDIVGCRLSSSTNYLMDMTFDLPAIFVLHE